MEEEFFDLRSYIQTLIRGWVWIVLSVLLLGAGALIFTLVQPKIYESVAIVSVVDPNEFFESSIVVSVEDEDDFVFSSYSDLAFNNVLLTDVIEGSNNGSFSTVGELRQSISIEENLNDLQIRFVVNADSSAEAMNIANKWASRFVEEGQILHHAQLEETILDAETALFDAEENLRNTEQEVSAYQRNNLGEILDRKLVFLHARLVDLLTNLAILKDVKESVLAFQDELDGKPATRLISTNEQLVFLQFELLVYQGELTRPLIFQIDSESQANDLTAAELLSDLDNLLVLIGTKEEVIIQQQSETETQILILQEQKQAIDISSRNLTRSLEMARQAYETTETAYDVVNSELVNSEDKFRVVQQATLPKRPLGINNKIIILAAIMLGVFLGGFIVFAKAWWQQGGNK